MENTAFTRLSAAQVAALLPRENLTILDTRDEAAFDKEHIDGATPLNGGNLDAVILGTSRQRPVLIYCYHGHASVQYAKMFADFGFTEVYDLVGGYEAWRAYRNAAPAAVPSPALAAWLSAQGYPSDDIDSPVLARVTPLMRAARLGEVAIAAELIACGAALDAANPDGNNALWLACFCGDPELVDLLIDKGIDIDRQNDNGATCLMYAASAGKTEIVRRLLAAGADTTLTSLDDFTALDMAANIECLRLLRHASPRRSKAA